MNNKMLSVVMPCYNEEKNIEEIIKRVCNSPVENKEIIVINDCSYDRTEEILKSIDCSFPLTVICNEKNLGKGASIRKGISVAKGDIIIIQDADLEYNPDEYPLVINPIFNGEADVVYGSRFLCGKANGQISNILANLFLTRLSNFFTGLKSTDMETCYKAFRREIIQNVELKENRFGFEPEVTAKIAKMNVRFMEVPISYYPRTSKEGKKIGIKDGIRAIYCIIKYK